MPRRTVDRRARYVSANSDENAATTAARNRFWQAVAKVCPEAIQSLHDDVYPSFERASQGLDVRRISLRRAQDGSMRTFEEFVRLLSSWAEGFNCGGEGWLLERAFDTMKLWLQYPHLRQKRTLDLDTAGGWSAISPGAQEFQFRNPGWNPTSERWGTFESRIREAFRRCLEEYREGLLALTGKRGYVPAPTKRHWEEHFEWLVLYQVTGKSYADVANEQSDRPDSVSTAAIQQGVKDAARLARMNLRPGRRGPKRKSIVSSVTV
jgi:hypothetical protein